MTDHDRINTQYRTRFTKRLGLTRLAQGQRRDEFLAVAQAHRS